MSWRLSNTLDTSFCIEALEEALNKYPQPEIFNKEQGSQFTSKEFTSVSLSCVIRISMDYRGRVLDNIFIKRFWRNLKYEGIYIKGYENMIELREGVKKYMNKYNTERLH